MPIATVVEPPPLCQYKPLVEYYPTYGDYVVWSRWFSTWHGFIINNDEKVVDIIFSGVPFLLFTMTDEEQKRETYKIKLDTIRNSHQGNWAIQKHDSVKNTIIWYI